MEFHGLCNENVVKLLAVNSQWMQLRSWGIFEECGTILAFSFLYPMSVHSERTAINNLSRNAKQSECHCYWSIYIWDAMWHWTCVFANNFTFRSTLTRYGSFNESSMRNGSIVYRSRLIRTIARTHKIAYWNFLRALNWLWRRNCNFKRGKTYILSLFNIGFRCK